MSDFRALPPAPAAEERRAELRVPATTLGDVRSRLVGGSDFALLNYTSQSLYGQSQSRLLIGSRISVRLATASLNAVLSGRVVRAVLTSVTGGVPRYEVAVSLEQPFDWGDAPVAAVAEAAADAVPEAEAEAAFAADDDAVFEADDDAVFEADDDAVFEADDEAAVPVRTAAGE